MDADEARAAPRGLLALMIDVRPLPSGQWLATCECGEERRFSQHEGAWEWLLDHPCYLDWRDAP